MIKNLNRHAIAVHVAVTGFILGAFERRDDRGQGSVEYVGIVLVVVVVVVVIGALVVFGPTIGNAIGTKISTAVDGIGG